MTRRKRTFVGWGRVPSGASKARLRRLSQAQRDAARILGPGLGSDRTGRLRVSLGGAVPPLPANATPEQVEQWARRVDRALRGGGIVE